MKCLLKHLCLIIIVVVFCIGSPALAKANDKTAQQFFKEAQKAMNTSYTDAVKLFTKAIEKNPNFAKAYRWRSVCRRRLGQYKLALSDANKAVVILPRDSWGYYHRASAYMRLKQYKPALYDLDKALRIAPNAQHYAMKAKIYTDLNDFDKAEKLYNQAIQFDPKDPYCWKARGIYFEKVKGDIKKAEADYNQALKLDPDDGNIYRQFAYMYQGTGHLDKAIDYYTKAMKLPSQIPVILFHNRGQCYRATGQYQKAIVDLTDALRIEGASSNTLVERAKVLNAVGKFSLADKDLSRYSTLSKKGNQTIKVGSIDILTNEFKKIVDQTTTEINKGSKDQDVYYDRGLARFCLGNFKGTISDLKKYLVLNKWQGQSSYYAACYLYFAQRELGQIKESKQQLKLTATKLSSKRWQFKLIGFMQGKVTEKELMKAVPKRTLTDQMKAHFIVGMFYSLNKQWSLAKAHLQYACANADFDEEEYLIALKQLKAKMGSEK